MSAGNGTAPVAAPIGRFANPDATDVVDLGPCRCPGTPHERDSATYRTSLGAGERASIGVAGWGFSKGIYYDWEAAKTALIAQATVSWNLVNLTGKPGEPSMPVPITFATCALLDKHTREAIADAINAAHQDVLEQDDDAGGPLPNASGAPSRDSSQGSASHTRTRQRRK